MQHFNDILEANLQFAADFRLQGLAAPAAKGLGVLTCIDSRIPPLAMLGLKPGDAKIFRNAGAHVTDDALRSLILATNLLGVRRIMIVAHTDCAMAQTSDDELRERLAIAHPEADFSSRTLGAAPDQVGELELDVERIRSSRLMAPGIVVAGFVYDVESGLLRQAVE